MSRIIKIMYMDQESTFKIDPTNLIYKDISKFLNIVEDDLIIIIDNDYNKTIKRTDKFLNQYNQKQFWVYNIKELLREKFENQDKQKQNKINMEQNNNSKIDNDYSSLQSTQCTNSSIVQSQIQLNGDQQFQQKDQQYPIDKEIQNQNSCQSSTFSNQSDQEDIFQNSVFKVQLQTCYKCNNKICETSIQTKCLHNYHQECLEEHFNNQLSQFQSRLNCICNQKIIQKILINNFQNGKEMAEKLYKNQITEIEQNYSFKIRKCTQTNQCCFIYIKTDNTSKLKPYCPCCCEYQK
ncbi:unnamed protein product [Paramecium sonneborni]|uniref:RING-type domain-containing protein n=1 Tax=Paramecium sonneborni TaxID=65129 RepID=A0A8S1Q0U6_9CILI|nr:unnamed protein product [Paramecium sonneborni]